VVTDPPTNAQTHKHTDRTDYNTLRRSLARSVIKVTELLRTCNEVISARQLLLLLRHFTIERRCEVNSIRTLTRQLNYLLLLSVQRSFSLFLSVN